MASRLARVNSNTALQSEYCNEARASNEAGRLVLTGHVLAAPPLLQLLRPHDERDRTANGDASGVGVDGGEVSVLEALAALPAEAQLGAALAAAAATLVLVQQPDGSCALAAAALPPRGGGRLAAAVASVMQPDGALAAACGSADAVLRRRLDGADARLTLRLAAACGIAENAAPVRDDVFAARMSRLDEAYTTALALALDHPASAGRVVSPIVLTTAQRLQKQHWSACAAAAGPRCSNMAARRRMPPRTTVIYQPNIADFSARREVFNFAHAVEPHRLAAAQRDGRLAVALAAELAAAHTDELLRLRPWRCAECGAPATLIVQHPVPYLALLQPAVADMPGVLCDSVQCSEAHSRRYAAGVGGVLAQRAMSVAPLLAAGAALLAVVCAIVVSIV